MCLISSRDKIFVFVNTLLIECGEMIAIGETLETVKSVFYHARVFNPIQFNYLTHEQELLAVVDILKTYYHLMTEREFILLIKNISPRVKHDGCFSSINFQ